MQRKEEKARRNCGAIGRGAFGSTAGEAIDKGNPLLDPANGIAFAYTFPRAVKSIGRALLVSRTEKNRDPGGLDAAARLCYMEATFYVEATSAPCGPLALDALPPNP